MSVALSTRSALERATTHSRQPPYYIGQYVLAHHLIKRTSVASAMRILYDSAPTARLSENLQIPCARSILPCKVRVFAPYNGYHLVENQAPRCHIPTSTSAHSPNPKQPRECQINVKVAARPTEKRLIPAMATSTQEYDDMPDE